MQTGEFSLSVFEVDKEKGLVNLTLLAKSQGKRLDFYLKSKETKEFLSAIEELTPNGGSSIQTINGRGTWANREIALDLAQWISPRFKVFCLKHLDQLFQTGSTALQPSKLDRHELIFQGYQALLQEREALQEDINMKAQQIKDLAPAASYAKEVLQSKSDWTITTIADQLGMTNQRLNKELYKKGIQYKDGDGVWVLYAEHKGKGYTKSRTNIHHNTKNEPITTITTTWTEKGRNFIHSVFGQGVMEL